MIKKIKVLVIVLSLLTSMGFLVIDLVGISDFKLKNTDGKIISLSDYKEAKGFIIVFTCNHCPFAKLYPERLNALNEKYAKLGVPLIAISSTDTTLYEEDIYFEMCRYAKKEKFNFPYLYDAEQKVAKTFNAQKTPHAYVIWKEKHKWVVKYNGAIDDNGMDAKEVKSQFVSGAVDELLANKTVSVAETKSIGCQIYFRENK